MYVAVKGGEAAIDNAHRLLADRRRGDRAVPALTLDQIWSARPVLGHANYRTPVERLYLCAAGAHPGGGVSGLPGHNAAREIARDLKRRKD